MDRRRGRLVLCAGQGVGRCWSGGVPATAFPKIVSQISPKARLAPGCAGIPSRKLRSAGPRPPGPGGAPHRTYDLDQADAVWLPPVRDGSRRSAGHPGVARVQGRSPGRRRPAPGRRAGGPARRRQKGPRSVATVGRYRVGPLPAGLLVLRLGARRPYDVTCTFKTP